LWAARGGAAFKEAKEGESWTIGDDHSLLVEYVEPGVEYRDSSGMGAVIRGKQQVTVTQTQTTDAKVWVLCKFPDGTNWWINATEVKSAHKGP
jgi:hypothetical protein